MQPPEPAGTAAPDPKHAPVYIDLRGRDDASLGKIRASYLALVHVIDVELEARKGHPFTGTDLTIGVDQTLPMEEGIEESPSTGGAVEGAPAEPKKDA